MIQRMQSFTSGEGLSSAAHGGRRLMADQACSRGRFLHDFSHLGRSETESWGQKPKQLSPLKITPATHLDFSQCQSSHNSSQTVALLLEDQGFRHSCLWDLLYIQSTIRVISLLFISCVYACTCVNVCACLCTCAQECQKRMLDFFGAGVTAICRIPGMLHGSWNLNSGPHDYTTSSLNH